MKKLFILISMFVSTATFAQEEAVLNFLAEKMVSDFHQGLKIYNQERGKDLPEIKSEDEIYSFSHKKNVFRFSMINYLNDQIYINNQLKTVSQIKAAPVTTLFDYIIKPAHAEEDLDAASAKVLLQTLSSFSGKLEKIGFTCITSSCKKDIRDKNLAKIRRTLDEKRQDCEERQADTGDSLKKFERSQSTLSLAMTVGNEFNSVKEFMKKIASANKKDVNNFLEDHLNVETKPHQTCLQVMVAGTAGEVKGGLSNLATYAAGGANQGLIDEAKKTCVEMEQLKSCLLTLQENSVSMNNIKRQAKQNDLDHFPDAKSGFSKAMSK